jgi:transposase
MNLNRKKYTADFKRMVIDELLTSGQSQVTLEQKYKIGAGCLCRWVREAEQHKDEAFPGQGLRHASAAELAALQRQVQNLTEQNTILKKALQIVAQSPQRATP